jgi:prepilin-type N-terminal cleavage/methylation domain-containing protein
MQKFFKEKKIGKAGFTLVELLVTISMFVVITGVVLVNSNQFDNSVLLRNFTYDIALTIKQAQTYGVNVNENSQGSFNNSYGVYFDINDASNGGSNTNFVIFSDFDTTSTKYRTDSVTTCSVDSECIKKYSMNRGAHIKSICVSENDNICDTKTLSILFERPKLDAKMYSFDSGIPSDSYKYVKINLESGDGATSSVVVTSVGQIYVKE